MTYRKILRGIHYDATISSSIFSTAIPFSSHPAAHPVSRFLVPHQPAARQRCHYEIFPPPTASCDEQFENIANSLKPGDELVLHGGSYSQSCYRSITVNGTAANPIIIRAAAGEKPVITKPAATAFTDPNQLNFWPTAISVLLGKANVSVVASEDFI